MNPRRGNPQLGQTVADLDTLTSYDELRYMPQGMVRNWTEAHRKRLASPDANPEMGRRVIENRTRILHALHDEACHSGEIWLLRKLYRLRDLPSGKG